MDQNRFKLLGIFVLLATAFVVQFFSQPSQASGFLRVVALDIGQGDSILITTPTNQQVLVDGGPSSDVASKVSRYIGGDDIDLVVATHNDADHIGGLSTVVNNFNVKQAWINGALHTTHTYENWLTSLKDNQVPTKDVRAGEELDLGQVNLKVLYPTKDYTGIRPEDSNSASIVIKLTYGATSFLLTGDLEKEGEEELIRDNAADLASTVLKVGHHGSKYSTFEDFLNYVHPKLALISVGENNRYGHPAPETIKRLEAASIEYHRTDAEGDLVTLSDGARVWLEQ